MRAAIVTVGTEITDGQIIDRNSNWLSQKLDALDIQIHSHHSVPDNTSLMLEAFAFASQHAELVFICGGLGPTVDDFTRDVISEFAKRPLVLNEPAFKVIEEKISGRNLPVREGHKRQALLPEGAIALENTYGVAPGFYLEINKNKIWALPGPPREIEAIWNSHIEGHLKALPRSEKYLKLQTWLCLGVAESEVAQICEDFFKDYAFEKLHGYRIQLPYVEVKLWYDSRSTEAASALALFTEKIKDIFVGYNLKQVYAPFLELVKNYPRLHVSDNFSEGLLLQKLQQIIPESEMKKMSLNYSLTVNSTTSSETQNSLQKEDLLLDLNKTADNKIVWTIQTAQTKKQITVDLPLKRTSNYTKLYALEALLTKVSLSTLMTS